MQTGNAVEASARECIGKRRRGTAHSGFADAWRIGPCGGRRPAGGGLSPSGGLRCPIRSGRSLRHARASGGKPPCVRVHADATGRPRRTQQQIEILELPVHYALKRVRLQPGTHSRAERTQAHSAIAQPRPLRCATTRTGATVEPLREPLRVDRCAVRRGDRCKCACLLLREVRVLLRQHNTQCGGSNDNGNPYGLVSHTTWYPVRHGIPYDMVSRTTRRRAVRFDGATLAAARGAPAAGGSSSADRAARRAVEAAGGVQPGGRRRRTGGTARSDTSLPLESASVSVSGVVGSFGFITE